MTLKDYEFLISTMEKIASLDLKLPNLNEQRLEMISQKNLFENELNSSSEIIKKLQKTISSVNVPDVEPGFIGEKENLILEYSDEIYEMNKKWNTLDSKIRANTSGKAYQHWKKTTSAYESPLVSAGRSVMGAALTIPVLSVVFFGMAIFQERIPDDPFRVIMYWFAGCMVPSALLLFVLARSIAKEERENILPLVERLESRKSDLTRDIKKIEEIRKRERDALKDVSNALNKYGGHKTNLKEEEEKLISLRESLESCISEIELIESEIAKINHEIVSSLESVSHLTPYNSEL